MPSCCSSISAADGGMPLSLGHRELVSPMGWGYVSTYQLAQFQVPRPPLPRLLHLLSQTHHHHHHHHHHSPHRLYITAAVSLLAASPSFQKPRLPKLARPLCLLRPALTLKDVNQVIHNIVLIRGLARSLQMPHPMPVIRFVEPQGRDIRSGIRASSVIAMQKAPMSSLSTRKQRVQTSHPSRCFCRAGAGY